METSGVQRILVSGASGLLGRALLPELGGRGFQVARLVRGAAAGSDSVAWDPEGAEALAPASVSGYAAVIHLAGESIVGRWTEAKKQRILSSRVLGTRKLAEALARAPQPPGVFISSSAIGYYGNRGDEILRESSAPGNDFLSGVCRQWEAACEPASSAGIRTVQVRTGVVLSKSGGALQKMLTPFRLGLGGNMGSGRQWMSWIHVADWVGAVLHVLDATDVRGPVNLVAPQPVTNAEFTRTLASVLSRPAVFPMPGFAVRLMFGEMGDALLLGSQRVEPAALLASGYRFRYTGLQGALAEILKG